MLRQFPLTLIVIIVYNFMAFGGWAVGNHNLEPFLLNHAVTIPLVSGDKWTFSLADLFLLVTLILLFVEIIKATRTTAREIINHGLSMLTFIVALIEFIALKGFATSTFFFLMAMSLFDVIAGYTISIVAAEHDLGLGRAGTD
jgi:hypothetical protein